MDKDPATKAFDQMVLLEYTDQDQVNQFKDPAISGSTCSYLLNKVEHHLI